MNRTPGIDRERQLEAEQALLHGQTTDMDASSELYRRIFEILKEPLPVGLEPGFSHRVTAIAIKSHQRNKDAQEPWPVVALMLGLFGVFVLALVQKLSQTGWNHGFDLPSQATIAVALVALGDLWIKRRFRGRSRRLFDLKRQ